MSALTLLEQGLQTLKCNADSQALMHYLSLMEKWNKAYNLTAIRALDEMVIYHLLDSLAIHPWLKGDRHLDIGTGAGLPGIPLAIAYPHQPFTLLDSNGKKVRFLQEVKRQLGLANVEIIYSRAEDYRPLPVFDTIISRAVSSVEQLITWTKHLIAKQGIWLSMKGRYPDDELNALDLPYHVHTYTVPMLPGERCCVVINHKTEE